MNKLGDWSSITSGWSADVEHDARKLRGRGNPGAVLGRRVSSSVWRTGHCQSYAVDYGAWRRRGEAGSCTGPAAAESMPATPSAIFISTYWQQTQSLIQKYSKQSRAQRQHFRKILKPPQSLPLQMAERLLRAQPDSVANHVTDRSISDWRALTWKKEKKLGDVTSHYICPDHPHCTTSTKAVGWGSRT